MILHDSGCGKSYTQELCNYHVGAAESSARTRQPESITTDGKAGKELLLQFKRDLDQINRDTV